jgi:Fe-S cluster assembly protein SufD
MDYAEHYQTVSTDLPGQSLSWLQALRTRANIDFSTSGFPSPREEEWRYTNITPIEKKRFTPKVSAGDPSAAAELIQHHRLADTWSLVFVDGVYSAGHSRLTGLPESIQILPISEALERYPEKVHTMLQQAADCETHGFIAFNTAYFRDGAFIVIPDKQVPERPIQLLHVSTQAEGLSVLRHLISLGIHAQATVIETYVGEKETACLTAAVTEIDLAANAHLDHYKLQNESDRTFHFGGIYSDQKASARFRQHHAAFGGLMARTEIHSHLGQSAECDLDGLFLASGRRHLDTHTILRHHGAHAVSRESYRGIASERGRGVFSGRIVVDPQAQKTDAEMNNRNLLLSDDAEIDSKPQLEIHADDVKCAHGVTVGQLSAESIFYLQSRGIDESSARNMLTFAFANEMVEKIRHDGHRQQVRDALLANLPQTDVRGDWL